MPWGVQAVTGYKGIVLAAFVAVAVQTVIGFAEGFYCYELAKKRF